MVDTSTLYSQSQQEMLDTIHTQFTLSDDILLKITKTFLSEAAEGLASYGLPMAMIPTFVELIPDGSETGTFLALDLGGTNLRVCEVTFNGDKTFKPDQETYPVPDELKTGTAAALFDHLAKSVDCFLKCPKSCLGAFASREEEDPGDNSNPPYTSIAFTFSFPIKKTALDSGTLLRWTKGYSIDDAVGQDIVKLLQDAFNRNGIHVKCVAILNDTVGTLLSRAYASGGCILGAIFGTGTNGAYVEEVANITKLGNELEKVVSDRMIVNTEWGAFNDSRSALQTTSYDEKLDKESLNPGEQAFEKFISGMYLGEIARLVILSFVDASPESLLFEGHHTEILDQYRGVDTEILSRIEEAWQGKDTSDQANASEDSNEEKLKRVRDVIVDRFGFDDPSRVSLADAGIVQQIGVLVATRGASLSACAIAATLVQTGHARCIGSNEATSVPLQNEGKTIDIGVDGSLIQYYPRFKDIIRETLRKIVGSEVEKRVEIEMAKDGSGVGAALCALIAQKQTSFRLRRFKK